MSEAMPGPGDPIQVTPVVVLLQVFPARPSSIPDIRDFVRRCLAESPLTEEGTREVSETVFRALLDAAGPTGYIQVAFRIFPEHVEVDVLHSDNQITPPVTAPNGSRGGQAADRTATTTAPPCPTAARGGRFRRRGCGPAPGGELAGTVPRRSPGHPDTFADRMSTALRREGLTQEAAARMLGVSVKRSAAGSAAPPSRG